MQENVDPYSTINEIRQTEPDRSLKKAVNKVMKPAWVFLSNVSGTTPYWNSTRFEMKAINLYKWYINNQHISIFHTGSLVDFHKFSFRRLLAKYITVIYIIN